MLFKPSNEQFPFKENPTIETESFIMYRDNRFAKATLNNRHGVPMGEHYWNGYGYLIFSKGNQEALKGGVQVGVVWFLNQVTGKSTYIRISRYMSLHSGCFIAVLDELNTHFNTAGYTLRLKTSITYAQEILNKNYQGSISKQSTGKRGMNDRAKQSSSVNGISYDLSDKLDTFEKWHGKDNDTVVEA